MSEVNDVPIEQQLELALRLLGNTPLHKELWHTNLDLISAKLKIADLERELEKERANNVRR
jgi:hypothetical protein